MNNIPTYYDLKYQANTIFEGIQINDFNKLTPDQINEGEKVYHEIVERLEKGEDIDEGLLGALIGGAAGALVGPAIGKAICKVMGIDTKGHLGKLMTSRLVTTALGIAIGK